MTDDPVLLVLDLLAMKKELDEEDPFIFKDTWRGYMPWIEDIIKGGNMPIGNMTVHRGNDGGWEKPFSEHVPPGNYRGKIISVEECLKDVYQQPGKKEEAIQIVYGFEHNGQGVTYTEKCKLSAHPKSNLYKRLSAICPTEVTPEALGDDVKYIALVNSMEGRSVALMTNEKMSQRGTKYPICVAVMATQDSGPEQSTKPVPEHVAEDSSLDDDEIPF